MYISAIIVAAGKGYRVGGSMPKQFQAIAGKPILVYTLLKFEECALIDDIVVVASEDWLLYVSQDIVDRFNFKKVKKLIAGGTERQDSVFAGLKVLNGPPDIVAVHDAVRPFISINKIEETIDACKKYDAAILAIQPTDTIKTDKAGFVDKTPFRNNLWSVQTPQVFKYNLIYQAYLKAFEQGLYDTDDSALVERLGHPVKIVKGEHRNIKITTPLDFQLAEVLLNTE